MVDLVFLFFGAINFHFIYFEAVMLGVYTFKIIITSC